MVIRLTDRIAEQDFLFKVCELMKTFKPGRDQIKRTDDPFFSGIDRRIEITIFLKREIHISIAVQQWSHPVYDEDTHQSLDSHHWRFQVSLFNFVYLEESDTYQTQRKVVSNIIKEIYILLELSDQQAGRKPKVNQSKLVEDAFTGLIE